MFKSEYLYATSLTFWLDLAWSNKRWLIMFSVLERIKYDVSIPRHNTCSLNLLQENDNKGQGKTFYPLMLFQNKTSLYKEKFQGSLRMPFVKEIPLTVQRNVQYLILLHFCYQLIGLTLSTSTLRCKMYLDI